MEEWLPIQQFDNFSLLFEEVHLMLIHYLYALCTEIR